MTSFSGLGIGLSLVFGCLLLAIVAELYYVLWWKKRIIHRQEIEDEYNNYAKGYLFQLFCWKKPSSLHSNNIEDGKTDQVANGLEPDPELGASKDLLLKAFGEESEVSELMRLHNLAGPPRFLFTIKEETKEDLESDDGKSRGDRSWKGSRTRTLSDLMVTLDSPFFTPLASPTMNAAAASLNGFDSYHHHGFNPLFESLSEAELNRLRSSPPPKFKFLRDAEEKLLKRLMIEESEKRVTMKDCSVQHSGVKTLNTSNLTTEVREGSFLKFIVGHHFQQYPSSTSQVLPLASSPTTFRPLDQKPIVH